MSDKISTDLEKAYRFVDNRNYDEALRQCNAIVLSNPTRQDALRTLADIYAHKGDYSAASDTLHKLISMGSKEPNDYFTLGRAELFRGNNQAAVGILTEAIELGEKYKDSYYSNVCYFLRAEALLRLNRYKEALKDCDHLKNNHSHYLPNGKRTRTQIVAEAEAGLAKSKDKKWSFPKREK